MLFRLGLGAQIPQDGERPSVHARHRSSNLENKMQQQFMGKTSSGTGLKKRIEPRSYHEGRMLSKSKLNDSQALPESDEEFGRTAILGRNAAAPIHFPRPQRPEIAVMQGASTTHLLKAKQDITPTAASRKLPRSYLDEVLVERSRKRKKKKQVKNRQS